MRRGSQFSPNRRRASVKNRSSGIRGGCQSVVKRIESCHALIFCMERRGGVLRRGVRASGLNEAPFDCRAVSQPNNSRAWRADSFLTFLTASSTALMFDTLAQNQREASRLCLRRVGGAIIRAVFRVVWQLLAPFPKTIFASRFLETHFLNANHSIPATSAKSIKSSCFPPWEGTFSKV